MAARRNHANMKFQRHGEYTTVLVGFQTAGGNQAFGLKDGSRDPEPILPMRFLGIDFDPIFLVQIIKIDNPDIQGLHQRKNAFVLHDRTRRGIASLSKADRFSPHLPNLFYQSNQCIIVR